MSNTNNIINVLQNRRRQLGMPYKALAKRANLGMVTVQRALNGETGVRFDTIAAIAECLGINFEAADTIKVNTIEVNTILEQQARQKAKHLVALTQGSAGLEGQGVGIETRHRVEDKIVHELLAGSKKRLWVA